jgi:hypothetical protein
MINPIQIAQYCTYSIIKYAHSHLTHISLTFTLTLTVTVTLTPTFMRIDYRIYWIKWKGLLLFQELRSHLYNPHLGLPL